MLLVPAIARQLVSSHHHHYRCFCCRCCYRCRYCGPLDVTLGWQVFRGSTCVCDITLLTEEAHEELVDEALALSTKFEGEAGLMGEAEEEAWPEEMERDLP